MNGKGVKLFIDDDSDFQSLGLSLGDAVLDEKTI